MQKLNRFVTYIYSYRDSQRDTNVGFAKVDCGDTDAAGGNSDRSHEV